MQLIQHQNILSDIINERDYFFTNNQSFCTQSNVRQGDTTRRKLFQEQQNLKEIALTRNLNNQEIDEEKNEIEQQYGFELLSQPPSKSPPKKHNIMFRVLNLFSKLLNVKHQFRLEELNMTQLQILNDASSQNIQEDFIEVTLTKNPTTGRTLKQPQSFRKKQSSIHRFFSKLNNNIPVISPRNPIKLLWEYALYFLSVVGLLYHPFELAFLDKSVQTTDLRVNIQQAYFIIFTINIFVQLDSSFFKYGDIVTMRKQIFQNYLMRQFIFDLCLIISLSIYQIYYRAILNFFRTLLFLERILFSDNQSNQILQKLLSGEQIRILKEISELFSKVLICCHIAACYFYLLGTRSQEEEGQSWIQESNNHDFIQNYVDSFYFMVVTMSTIGYGDFVPVTLREKLFMIFMAFFASGLFGYTVNTLGNIFLELQKQKEDCRNKIQTLTNYMDDNQVQPQLQIRAKKYIEFIIHENLNLEQAPGMCLDQLSPFLQDQIRMSINLRIVERIPFLSKNFSQAFLEQISMRVQEKLYPPDDIICLEQTKTSPQLYYITKGKVSLSFNLNARKKNKPIHFFQENDFFGQIQFFTNSRDVSVTAKSVGITCLKFLDFSDFWEEIQDFPEDRQKFLFLHNQITYQKQLYLIDTQCFSCLQTCHNLVECPFLTYSSQTFQPIAQKLLFDQLKFTRRYKRQRTQKSKNSRQQFQFYMEKAESYGKNKDSEIQAYYDEHLIDEEVSSDDESDTHSQENSVIHELDNENQYDDKMDRLTVNLNNIGDGMKRNYIQLTDSIVQSQEKQIIAPTTHHRRQSSRLDSESSHSHASSFLNKSLDSQGMPKILQENKSQREKKQQSQPKLEQKGTGNLQDSQNMQDQKSGYESNNTGGNSPSKCGQTRKIPNLSFTLATEAHNQANIPNPVTINPQPHQINYFQNLNQNTTHPNHVTESFINREDYDFTTSFQRITHCPIFYPQNNLSHILQTLQGTDDAQLSPQQQRPPSKKLTRSKYRRASKLIALVSSKKVSK